MDFAVVPERTALVNVDMQMSVAKRQHAKPRSAISRVFPERRHRNIRHRRCPCRGFAKSNLRHPRAVIRSSPERRRDDRKNLRSGSIRGRPIASRRTSSLLTLRRRNQALRRLTPVVSRPRLAVQLRSRDGALKEQVELLSKGSRVSGAKPPPPARANRSGSSLCARERRDEPDGGDPETRCSRE